MSVNLAVEGFLRRDPVLFLSRIWREGWPGAFQVGLIRYSWSSALFRVCPNGSFGQ